ncbi:MAG: serine hydroxymethyltransferase, partial [Gammaproteobacteria bacterium]|nr:serine hydroxymethyltransferase [Gammaproteobacteria bacterium]
TTTKTMRGPRGGIILARESSWAKKLQSAIFPGVQGSLHSQIIAAKAVCLGEALGDDFKGYGRQVIDNAKTLARVLLEHGIKLVSGGTDTHMVLLDFSSRNLTGQQVQDTLAKANITSNKNPIPFDSNKPSEWSGLRLGVSAATTRGLGSEEFNILGAIITRLIDSGVQENEALFEQCRNEVLALCDEFPIYQEIVAGP